MKIKCLSNGFSSLKNSHNPFGKGFQLPPYGKIPVEHFSYVVNWVNWSYSCREIFLYRYSSEWKFISGTNFGGKRAGNMAHGVQSEELTHFCKCDCSVKQRVTAASDGGAMFCSNAKMSRIGGAVEKKRSTLRLGLFDQNWQNPLCNLGLNQKTTHRPFWGFSVLFHFAHFL